jgi:RNA polymerase sigma factor (sigma-70 family)
MPSGQHAVFIEQVQRLFGRGTIAGLSEGAMLERFVANGDDDAFQALMALHGPMVLGVCRRLLFDPNDVDDAFQATFVVLVRKAAGLRDRTLLGPWLHGVARRVALRARANRARRRLREREPNEGDKTVAASDTDPERELRAVIDEEVGRLPERLRGPVILCYLEGRTYEEAARQLRSTAATVRGRLVQARERLRGRLVRRGVAPSAVLPLVAQGLAPQLPNPSAELLAMTLRRASAVRLGQAGSATVSALADGVLRSLRATRLAAVGLALSASVLSGAGLAVIRSRSGAVRALPHSPAAAVAIADHAAVEEKPAAPQRAAGRAGVPREREIHAITITGRAVDEAGRPVPGAIVQVTDGNDRRPSGADQVLGHATTGPDGRYVMRSVPLPVLLPDESANAWRHLAAARMRRRTGKGVDEPEPAPAEGRFQVAGWAPARAFAWHEGQAYRPGPRPVNERPGDGTVYYEGETIEASLTLGPPARLHGRVTDDQGKPLAGAKVQVGFVDDPRRPDGHGLWNCLAINPNGGDGAQFKGIPFVPEARRSARTDANGDYVIDGLPRETKLLALIDDQPSYEPLELTLATSTKRLENARSVGYDGTLNHRFVTPRTVRVHVTHGDDNSPAPRVTVIAEGAHMQRDGVTGKTDDQGNVVLRLLPGDYAIRAEPPFLSAYLIGQRNLTVSQQREQATSLTLPSAAIVELEAVDVDSGAGIRGVRFEYAVEGLAGRTEVQSQTVFVDHPTTGNDGRLRAVMAPGSRRFFVAHAPAAYQQTAESAPATLSASGLNRVRFALRARPGGPVRDPEPKAGASGVRDHLEARWRAQAALMTKGRLQAKRYTYYGPGEALPLDRVKAIVDSCSPTRAAALPDVFRREFPAAAGSHEEIEEVVDGGNRLQRSSSKNERGTRRWDHVTVFNGLESVQFRTVNAQVDIASLQNRGHVMFGTLGLDDFVAIPRVAGTITGRTARGAVLERAEAGRTERLVVDELSGFVVHETTEIAAPGSASERWQFAPRATPEGLLVPAVSVRMTSTNNELDLLTIDVIESIDLASPIAPNEFVVSVPAGTLIIDHRRGPTDSYGGVTRAPVTDVITYANARNARMKPVAAPSPGQAAPPIAPAVWLDQSGKIDAPKRAGKMTLVYFWGGPTPSLRDLNELREVVTQFRASDLLVIGLHESAGSAKDIAAFAAKHNLNFPLAIDVPSKEPNSFGATFDAYGIRYLAHAALIDRNGKLVELDHVVNALRALAHELK